MNVTVRIGNEKGIILTHDVYPLKKVGKSFS